MKNELISDSVKIFRLMPFFLGIAIIWSVATVIYTDEFKYIIDKQNDKWGAVAHFLGFYAGNGIPRFIIYGFCIGYIKYNYNKFAGNFDDIAFWAIGLTIIPCWRIYDFQKQSDPELSLWWSYLSLIVLEFILYKNFLTKKPATKKKK